MREKLPLIMISALISLALLCGRAQTSSAQDIPPQYLHSTWTTENGLPQNSVTSLLQTHDGYLWVGTFGGLARFDGIKFTVFDTGNSPGLKSNRIITLFEDHVGALWIGTEQGGLSRYFHGTFKTYTTSDGLQDNYVYSLSEDAEGGLWIATSNGKGLTRFADERFTRYTTKDGLADDGIFLLTRGPDGSLWGVSNSGLTRWQHGQFTAFKLPSDINFSDTKTLMASPDGSVWVAGLRVFARFRDGNFTFYSRSARPSSDSSVSVFGDRDGAPLFLLSHVPQSFDGGTLLTDQNLSRWTGLSAVLKDREGDIWVGSTGEGLHRYRPAQVRAFAADEGLADGAFLVIAGDGADGLWIGDHDLFHFSNGSFTKYTGLTGALETTSFWALLQDREGTIWTGSYAGLHSYRDGRWTTYESKNGGALTGLPVAAVYEDREGSLWIGTGSDGPIGGFYRFNNGGFIPYRAAEGLSLTDVRFITEDRAGALWLGGMTGMSRFKDGKFTNYTTAQGLSNNYVRDIYEDADGTLWIGTYGGGLNRFKDGRFTAITTKEGLFDNIVSRILEDDQGNLWMSCNRGIYRASRRELNDLADGRIKKIVSISYGVTDGMKSSETNGGCQPAGWKDHEGYLWFPTLKGVVRIDPNNLNKIPPPVVIEETLVDKTPVDSQSGLELRPGQNDLEIHYTGLSLTAPEKMRFKYKLEGYDQDWVDAEGRRVAYYTHISPGSYTFRVMAANNDGVWSTEDAALRVTIVPPFWRTWWFISLCVGAVAAVAFLLYKRRVRQLVRERVAQEAFSRQLIESQETERKRIAAELHDSLGQELLIIKNRATLSLKLLGDAERTKEQIEQISGSASQAITEVRQIAYNLRPYHLDQIGLTQSLEELIERVRNSGPIKFTSRIDNIDDLCQPDAAINLYRIVQEGLNNIVKHSGASEAKLIVKRNAREIEVLIEDDGKGFSTEKETTRHSGFGLTGLSERARILGGTFNIQSSPGQGTTVTIHIPIQDQKHET